MKSFKLYDKALLQQEITCQSGNAYLLNTNYKLWIKFGLMLKNEEHIDVAFLLEAGFYLEEDENDILNQLIDFYNNANIYPRQLDDGIDDVTTELIDWENDGEYIYLAFLNKYNIDLETCEYLHWHKFKALFNGLFIGYQDIVRTRAYKGDDKKEIRERIKWEIKNDNVKLQDEKTQAIHEYLKQF